MTEDVSDRLFAERVLARLPASPPSPRLEAALLAAYDTWLAERPRGRWTAFAAGVRGFSQTVWPGAPVWAPATAFAVSLLIGATIGASLPVVSGMATQGFSLEQPQNFSLLTDAGPEDL